jgi:hypothetical protein
MSVGWCNLIAPQDNHRSRSLGVHRCSRGRCIPPNWNLRLPCRQCRHSKLPWPVTTALADDDSPTRVSSVRAPCPVPTPVSIAALTRRWYPRQTGPRGCSHERACWPLMADSSSHPSPPFGRSFVAPAGGHASLPGCSIDSLRARPAMAPSCEKMVLCQRLARELQTCNSACRPPGPMILVRPLPPDDLGTAHR